jgi:hypothetical protein
MQINYQQAKSLCTDAEFRLLSETKPGPLSRLTLGELRKFIPQARKYSDKWLQQSRKQGNSTDGAGARSLQKHEMFKEALARLEGKMAKLDGAAPAKKAVAKKAVAKKASAKKVVTKKAVAKKVVAKKAAKKTGAKKAAASNVVSKAAKKAAAKKAVARKVSGNVRSAMSLAKQAKQKSIGTSLRIAASGKGSRVRGHVSAQGRRNQAARSARKR